MMKFKNTLIIFLGIIAIIFAGCKEKKATHESGTLEEPKVETYEENGVNFTAGLPYVRTSPAHGTAYDIAGKDLASPDSMRAASYLACEIFKNRLEWNELHKNPLGFSKKEKEY